MSDRERTELLVIGGGPAGYAGAIRAAQCGIDVTLVERDAYGGTCLNYGCIPSKALISASDLAHRAEDADNLGIQVDLSVDFENMIRWKDRVVRRLTGGVKHLCENNGVTLYDGTGTFLEEGRARITREDAGDVEINFDHAMIATGSRSIELPMLPFDEPGIVDARGALDLDEIPESIAIVGGGYIGMELAGVFGKLGSEITVIEMLERPLAQYEEDLVEPVIERAEDLGIAFALGERVAECEQLEEGVAVVTTGEDDREGRYEAKTVLVAVGREPVSDTVGLEAIGIEADDRGFIPTDETGLTDCPNVYAVGDVSGDPMLAHAGMAEGVTAAETIAGESPELGAAVPEVVFTEPEIAVVGMDADEAEKAGHEPVVGRFPFQASGRALTVDRPEGFVRLVADADTEIVLGGAIVGQEASELIGEVGLAIEMEATIEDVAATIHAHPTLSEAIMEAAAHGEGRAIHRPN